MTGRPRKITIYQRGKKFNIKFYDCNGERKNKSTGESTESAAILIKKEIELLQLNSEAPTSAKARDLFFGEGNKVVPSSTTKDTFKDLSTHQQEIKRLKELIDYYRPYKEKYLALKNTIEGSIATSNKNAPTISEALDKYCESISHLARYKRNYYNYIKTFFDNYLASKVYEIKSDQIYDYLQETCKTPERWNRQRKQFTKFYNWASGLWTFHNPMSHVPTKREEEKEDPHFHSLQDVKVLIRKQNDLYHKAMLSVFFYSGVSAHEFRGLKVDDYFKLKKQWYLRVSPNEARNIKAGKRRRNIPVGTKLKKALDTYLEDHPGGDYLFPPIIQGCKTDYWNEGTLSRYLNNQIFPSDMDCKSTRRTYGSLQLRNGKTFAEVAALMGNSIKMVEQHYARFKSSEIKSDL
jgi:integrase